MTTQQTTSHTKGNWYTVVKSGDVSHGEIDIYSDAPSAIYADKTFIARTSSRVNKHVEANANLIAAAPELLEACKAVFTELNLEQATTSPAFQLVYKAIDKAEGRNA